MVRFSELFPNKLNTDNNFLTIDDGINNLTNVSELNFVGAVANLTKANTAQITLNIGASAILIPQQQSLFEAADSTAIADYSNDVGNNSWQNVKLLTNAATPNNVIVNNQLQILEINTGAVVDLTTSNIVLETSWQVETGNNLGIIIRYESEGNLLLLEFNENYITFKRIVSDAVEAIAYTSYSFVVGENYRLEIRVIGTEIKALVNGQQIFRYFSNLFLDATLFGLAQSDGAAAGTGASSLYD